MFFFFFCFTEMLQFVSNQAGDFPDLFSDHLCGNFQGSGSGGSSGGTLEPQLQRPYSQVQLQPFPPPPASPQLQSLPVKAAPAAPPAPPRSAPLLQPRPPLQPQLQQQAVMITPTFSSAPPTRIIQQPVIYQNAATSFQGSGWGAQATSVPGALTVNSAGVQAPRASSATTSLMILFLLPLGHPFSCLCGFGVGGA